MHVSIDDAHCPKCGQETLEQRSREDDHGRMAQFIVCANCGHQPNLYDISRQQIKKTREIKKKDCR